MMSRVRQSIVAGCAAVLLFVHPAPARDIATVAVPSGTASVRDGDDALFGQVSVRLQGVAAPEDSGRSREAGGPRRRRRACGRWWTASSSSAISTARRRETNGARPASAISAISMSAAIRSRPAMPSIAPPFPAAAMPRRRRRRRPPAAISARSTRCRHIAAEPARLACGGPGFSLWRPRPRKPGRFRYRRDLPLPWRAS